MAKITRIKHEPFSPSQQVVFVAPDGRIVGTKGGIPYVVGGAESDLRVDAHGKAQNLMKGVTSGKLVAVTPAELYRHGIRGDRGQEVIIQLMSGGEASGIGPALEMVVDGVGNKRAVLGTFHGFGAGILPQDQFTRHLVCLNDPHVAAELGRLGGSPTGSSRTKLGGKEMQLLWNNVEGVYAVFGFGGGDHTKNFKQLWAKALEEGKPLVVVVSQKTMDLDTALFLTEGKLVNTLPLGALTSAFAMRERWFDEFLSAAGFHLKGEESRGCVGNFFGRGAGWMILGATRCDPEYVESLRRAGFVGKEFDHLYNAIDRLGKRQVPLVPEFPCTIPQFVAEVNRVFNMDPDWRTVGVPTSEGVMFQEVDREYKRVAERLKGDTTGQKLVARFRKRGIEKRERRRTLHRLVEDENLRTVFEQNPAVAAQFFKEVLSPSLDVWGHPRLGVMPNLVNAVVLTLTDCKKTNTPKITYEARTHRPIKQDSILGMKVGAEMARRMNAGESGLVAMVFKPGKDPFLFQVSHMEPQFIPFEQIGKITETENNLTQLDPDYLRKCGIFMAP